MSNRERAKGLRGERDVRSLMELYGWTVRGLEGEGDHLALRGGLVLHLECKNQAGLRLPLWIRQAEAEAPEGTVPVVAYKHAARWRADLPLALFAESFGVGRDAP